MYTPHTESEIGEMLAVIGASSLEELVAVPDAIAIERPARPARAQPEMQLVRTMEGYAARNGAGGVRLVLGRRGVPALFSARRHVARDAGRVRHVLHAVSSRSLAGLPASDLRVAELHRAADRPRRRQRLGVRRRDRAGRRRHHGAQRDRAPRGARFARGPSELSRGAAHVCRGLDVDVDELPLAADGTTDLGSLEARLAEGRYAAVACSRPTSSARSTCRAPTRAR